MQAFDEGQPATHLAMGLEYIKLGWNLVVMPLGTKAPTIKNWNGPGEVINTAEKLIAKSEGGAMNIGLVHMPSGTVAIDVDDEAFTRIIFEEFGLDFDAILAAGPRIIGKRTGRAKVIFKAPADLKMTKVSWPKPNSVNLNDRMSVLELRSGINQDVLPPSVHPNGHNYEWFDGQTPWDYESIPEIPENLLSFWRCLEDQSSGLRDEVMQLCPWLSTFERRRPRSANRVASTEHQNIIGKYNAMTDVEDMLANGGYKRIGKRWLAPSSSTRIPGVVVFRDQEVSKVYSHHASDIIGDKHAHDAFSLLTLLVHNGDFNAALEDASRCVGVDRRPPPVPDVVVNWDAVKQAQLDRKLALKTTVNDEVKKTDEAVAPVVTVEHPAIVNSAVVEDFPAALLAAPGVLGEMMEWMLGCAQKPQPVLALGGAISLASTILANKVESGTGLRTNMYMVCVGDTSVGKDHSRKCIKLAMASAGLEGMVGGEEIASGQGLLSGVFAEPCSLFQPDEFGMWMKALSAKNAGSHQTSIITNLMKLFSSAGGVYKGTEFADKKLKARNDINFPCVNLHATTTPDPLFDSFRSSDIASGYLNRLLFLFAKPKRYKMRQVGATPPPQNIIDWMKAARGMTQGQVGGLTPQSAIKVLMDEDAVAMFDGLFEWQQDMEEKLRDGGLAHLWGRTWEHASKLALVCACAKHKDAADLVDAADKGRIVVTKSDAEWAISFVKQTIGAIQIEVESRVADSEFEGITKSVKVFIDAAGIKGLTHRELVKNCRKFRIEPVKQDAVMESLKRSQDVFLAQTPSPSGHGGRPRMAWVSYDFFEVYANSQSPTSMSAKTPNVGVSDDVEGGQGE